MKKKLLTMLVSVMTLFTSRVFASDVDILLQKLVEKGVLSAGEAQEIKVETEEQVKKDVAEGKSSILPQWVQNMKFNGDFRARYEQDNKDGSVQRDRGRIRFRLGSEMKVNNQVKVAAGLATGSGDPRSTNQTLTNTFEQPDIRLDYAYAQYIPASWLTIKGGRIKSIPFWQSSDFIWDTDINPGGVSGQLSFSPLSNLDVFVNTGFFIIDEIQNTTEDPQMYVLQPGVNLKFNDKVNLKTALTYYTFNNVKDAKLDYSSGTNTLSGGKLKYNYDSWDINAQLGIKEPLDITYIPYFAILGECINNPSPDDNNTGYSIGFKVGSESVKTKGQWQLTYLYRYLERDAFLDSLAPSPNAWHWGIRASVAIFRNSIRGYNQMYGDKEDSTCTIRDMVSLCMGNKIQEENIQRETCKRIYRETISGNCGAI